MSVYGYNSEDEDICYRGNDEKFPYDEECGWSEDATANEEEDNQATVEECKLQLASKDFIMEPAAGPCIKRYLNAGGHPNGFIDLLANNYHGSAQTANLLADWLIVAGACVEEVQELVENHLKDLIMKNFDQKKADSIFSGEPPSWIEEMIVYPPWRKMVYELADKHPDCLMLNFTIKLIADAGYQAEVGTMSSACNQLEVFSKVLATSVVNYFNAPADRASAKDLCKACCHSYQLFIYAQCLLHELLKATQDGLKKSFVSRVIQSLNEGAENNGRNVGMLSLIFIGCGTHPRVLYSLVSMLARKALNPGDITNLYKAYCSSDPPPVAFIRLPRLLEMLVERLFTPESVIPAEHLPKYIFLLAYATSVYEHWNENTRESVYNDEMKATIYAIERVREICAKDVGSTHLSADVAIFFQCIRYPVVAMGVMRWVEHCLVERNYVKVITEAAPLQIVLLDEIGIHHPLQHELIVSMLKGLFERNYPKLDTLIELEFKKTLIDRMVHILSRGYILPVVVYIRECMDKQLTDVSLLRHFVSEVLEMIGPPYSVDFISAMLPIVRNEEISALLKTPDGQDDVTQFIMHCENG